MRFYAKVYKNIVTPKKSFSKVFESEFLRFKVQVVSSCFEDKHAIEVFSCELCLNNFWTLEDYLNQLCQSIIVPFAEIQILFLFSIKRLSLKLRKENQTLYDYCIGTVEELNLPNLHKNEEYLKLINTSDIELDTVTPNFKKFIKCVMRKRATQVLLDISHNPFAHSKYYFETAIENPTKTNELVDILNLNENNEQLTIIRRHLVYLCYHHFSTDIAPLNDIELKARFNDTNDRIRRILFFITALHEGNIVKNFLIKSIIERLSSSQSLHGTFKLFCEWIQVKVERDNDPFFRTLQQMVRMVLNEKKEWKPKNSGDMK